MKLVDTHAHIYLDEFDADRPAMLERAEKEGLARIFLPAIDSSTHDRMLQLEAASPALCSAMMGLHPCSVTEKYKEELEIVRQFLEKRRFAAIGEIGLDQYWDKTWLAQQYEAFHQQTEWALEFDLPIVIHSRNATDECLQVVREHQQGRLRGVFHCFSGNYEQAKEAIGLGFYLGIGGVISFKNAGLDKVVEQLPLDNLVLETDAPYLAPVPYRGKRNEPAWLKYVVEKIAAIKGMDVTEVAAITTANAKKLFGS